MSLDLATPLADLAADAAAFLVDQLEDRHVGRIAEAAALVGSDR